MDNKTSKGKKWVRPVMALALLLIFALLVAIRFNNKKIDSGAFQERLQPVEAASVISRPFGEELRLAGTVVPFAEAKLAPRVMGRVSSVNVSVGQRVEHGQIMLTIDQADYLSALKQAEANLAMAEANSIQMESGYENAVINYQRMEELFRQGAVSKSQLETAKSQLAAAESGYKANRAQIAQCRAMLEKARTDYINTEIKAPFPGVVARRMVETGEMVSQQSPVFILIQDDPLLVKVHLPENLVVKVGLNQQVEVFVPAAAKIFKGTVNTIAPLADPVTRAFAAEIKLVENSREVMPGMVADLIFRVKQVESALVVPSDALLEEDSGPGLFVVEDGVALHRKVTTGITGGGYTQVLSGVRQGETVVVRGNHLLVDGMKVRVEGTVKENSGRGGEGR